MTYDTLDGFLSVRLRVFPAPSLARRHTQHSIIFAEQHLFNFHDCLPTLSVRKEKKRRKEEKEKEKFKIKRLSTPHPPPLAHF